MKQFINSILLVCFIALGFAWASSTKNQETSNTASSNDLADVNSAHRQALKAWWDSLYGQDNQASSSMARRDVEPQQTCARCPVCPSSWSPEDYDSFVNFGVSPYQIICPPLVCPPCPIRARNLNPGSENAEVRPSKHLPPPPWRPPTR